MNSCSPRLLRKWNETECLECFLSGRVALAIGLGDAAIVGGGFMNFVRAFANLVIGKTINGSVLKQ